MFSFELWKNWGKWVNWGENGSFHNNAYMWQKQSWIEQ